MLRAKVSLHVELVPLIVAASGVYMQNLFTLTFLYTCVGYP